MTNSVFNHQPSLLAFGKHCDNKIVGNSCSDVLFVKMLLVAGSTLLAAIPIGCSVGYPSVLLQQLNANDTTIKLDWDTASWIGSIHGIAGIPSIVMPVFMQWRGRRLAFTVACLINIIGWILSYTANTATSILISESVHGFGSQSIMAVGLLSMSEMLSPQTRNVSMALYLVLETLGMALVQIAGSFLHWRTVSIIVCMPLIVTLLAAFMWPESPSWLAYKGEFNKCAKAFTLLRGNGDRAQTELQELILAQKENLSRNRKCSNESLFISIWQRLTSKDFYLPAVHMIILLQTPYWSGCMAHIIYAADIIQKATNIKEAVFIGSITLNCLLFSSCVLSTFLIRYYQPKKVSLFSVSLTAFILLILSGVKYLQTVGLMPNESYVCLYLLGGYMFAISLIIPIVLSVSAELMPVKHRGIGGPLYVITTCLMHSSSLKSTPYLIKYISLSGTWLLFAVNLIICGIISWKYIPETKGRALQQLEDYYNYGHFNKRRSIIFDKCLYELIPVNE